jgi:hypothetical protein
MSEVEIDCDVVELCVARDAADAAFRKHCTEYPARPQGHQHGKRGMADRLRT